MTRGEGPPMTFHEYRHALVGPMTAGEAAAAARAWDAAAAAERERCAAVAGAVAAGCVAARAAGAGYFGGDETPESRAAYVEGVRAALAIAAAIRWGTR